jgi:hypothetical protein
MPDVNSGSKRAWRSAQSFEDLCELGARFSAGELDSFPGWGASSLDTESDSISKELVSMNQAGFLTLASQPGRPSQRAFVCGFARAKLARALVGAAREAGLGLMRQTPRGRGGPAVAVTVENGEPRVFTGHAARTLELELFQTWIGPSAMRELARLDYVSLHDPIWGRQRKLWAVIQTTLSRRS